MSDTFENHPYDPDFIKKYINDELSDQEIEDFSEHIKRCELCLKEWQFQLDNIAFSEAYNLPEIIKQITNIDKDTPIDIIPELLLKEEKKEGPENTFSKIPEFQSLFSNQNNIYKFAVKFLESKYAEKEKTLFIQYWNYIKDDFDWQKSQFKDEELEKEIYSVKKKSAIFGVDSTRLVSPAIILIKLLILLYINFHEKKYSQSDIINSLNSLEIEWKEEKQVVKFLIDYLNE